MTLQKKKSQLGMHPSTASGRLVKDLLFRLVCETGNNNCFRCGAVMTRETFTVEHKIPWLDSADPPATFFDLDNIAFSHHSCNSGNARHAEAAHGSRRRYEGGCRCNVCVVGNREHGKHKRSIRDSDKQRQYNREYARRKSKSA